MINFKNTHLIRYDIANKSNIDVIKECESILILTTICFNNHVRNRPENWIIDALNDLKCLDTLRYRIHLIHYTTSVNFRTFCRTTHTITQIKSFLLYGENLLGLNYFFSVHFNDSLNLPKGPQLTFKASQLNNITIPLHIHNFTYNEVKKNDFDSLLILAETVKNCLNRHIEDLKIAPLGLKSVLASEIKKDLLVLHYSMEKIKEFSCDTFDQYKIYMRKLRETLEIIIAHSNHIRYSNQA